jgi:hypothetical protein
MAAASSLSAADMTTPKKLIEFGWDEPDTSFMKQHILEMEKSPFDGCVFHIQYRKPNNGHGDFMWECWDTRAFTEQEVATSLEELKATKFTRFTHNFLRFNTSPGKLDWFDDFSAIANNAKLAAQVARQGRCKGVLFDIEQYGFPLFNYRKQRDASSTSWDDYSAQVRKRGHEVMTSFQEGFPGLTVFLTFGYSLPWAQSGAGKKSLADCDYGMMAPFMDGLLQGVKGNTRVVDGYELAYSYKDPAQFDKAYATMRTNLLPIVVEPKKYQEVFSMGFGLWLDNNWRKRGWDTNDFSKNFFTPEGFEGSLRKALQTADEYVWIYSETPRWWSKGGGAVKLPAAYEAAIRRARITGNAAKDKE